MVLIKLFLSYFKIGAFSFGGGIAMLPLIEKEIVHGHQWMTMSEFIDIFAISEMTPGPFAINTATYIGYKIHGVSGAIAATLGVSAPSFIIMSLIFYFIRKFKDSPYVDWVFKGLRPIVLGLIGAAAITVGQNSFVDFKSIILACSAFYFITYKELNPIIAIVIAGILGIILY